MSYTYNIKHTSPNWVVSGPPFCFVIGVFDVINDRLHNIMVHKRTSHTTRGKIIILTNLNDIVKLLTPHVSTACIIDRMYTMYKKLKCVNPQYYRYFSWTMSKTPAV